MSDLDDYLGRDKGKDDDGRMHGWEIASWTLTFMVVLLVIAAAWQRLDEQNQQSYVILPTKIVCQPGRLGQCKTITLPAPPTP